MRRQILRDECASALSSHMHQAQETYLLSAIEADASSVDRLLAFLEQTQLEEKLRQSYLLIRQRVFEDLYEAEPNKAKR